MSAKRKRRKKIRTITFPPKEQGGRRVIDMEAERTCMQLAAFDATKARRMEQHGVDEQFAKSQECGHSIGRLSRQLKWSNETAARRIAAGFRFAEIVTEYNKDVLGAPNPNPPAMDMNRVGGFSTREITKDHVKNLTNKYVALRGALGFNSDNGGAQACMMYRVLTMTCIEDADTSNWPERQLRDLLKGLDLVADMG